MADDNLGASTPDTGDAGSTGSSEPTSSGPITLTESTAFIPPGGKDPLTWDKFQSSYVPKDEFTRMRQRDAAERQSWQQQEQQRIRQELEREFRTQAQQRGAQTQAQDFIQQLESAPYVDGKTVASIVREVAGQLSQSQAALSLMQQQFQKLNQSVSGITGKWSQTELQQTFASTKSKLGLPDNPVIDDMLQDVYHSYTGWESEPGAFERMVGERWQGLQAALRAADQQRAAAARAQARPFAPAAAGGNARPGKPLLRGGESPEDIANRLWPGQLPVNT